MLLCSVWTPTAQRTSFILRLSSFPFYYYLQTSAWLQRRLCTGWYLPVDLPLQSSAYLDRDYFKLFKWHEKSNVKRKSEALCCLYSPRNQHSARLPNDPDRQQFRIFPQLNNVWTRVNGNRTIIWTAMHGVSRLHQQESSLVQIKA